MEEVSDEIAAGLKRMHALLTWWGAPAIGAANGTDAPMKRLQRFAENLQAVYGSASERHIQALQSTGEEVSNVLTGLLQARQPQDLIAAESKLLAAVLEGGSRNVRNWTEATQKIHECCVTFAREMTENVEEQAKDTGPQEPKPATTKKGIK